MMQVTIPATDLDEVGARVKDGDARILEPTFRSAIMQITRSFIRWILPALLVTALVVSTALAHPGSGIVVDRLGQVYFVDTGLGIWKVDRQGRVVRHEGPSFHWMTIDHEGRFSGVRLPEPLPRDVSVVGTRPALILGGDFPLTVGADGAVYYPQVERDGPVRIIRLTPSGGRTPFATLPEVSETGPDGQRVRARWIHGLAASHDGSLYYSERHAVRRIAPTGFVSLVAGDVTVPACLYPPVITEARLVPSLRGLDIGPDGAVYVAASACSTLLKITPEGDVSVVLRASDAWSPTGVAVSGRDLYVLEYRFVPGGPRDWLPRVRRVSPDGEVTVVATVRRR